MPSIWEVLVLILIASTISILLLLLILLIATKLHERHLKKLVQKSRSRSPSSESNHTDNITDTDDHFSDNGDIDFYDD